MAQIFAIVEAIKAIVWLLKELKRLLNEADERKAAEQREKLNQALDAMEKAKTDEEKRKALKDVARNSFK